MAESPADVDAATTELTRIGYDATAGYLRGGLNAWEVTGRAFDSLGVLTADQLKEAIEGESQPIVLDVRKAGEHEAGHISGATHVFLGHLRDQLEKIPAIAAWLRIAAAACVRAWRRRC